MIKLDTSIEKNHKLEIELDIMIARNMDNRSVNI